MKKNIVIGVLVITNALAIIYGFVQNSMAKAYEKRAVENERMALEFAKKAEDQMHHAAEFQRQTDAALKVAMENLELARQQAAKKK